jgi:alpha-L-rhamnosidase
MKNIFVTRNDRSLRHSVAFVTGTVACAALLLTHPAIAQTSTTAAQHPWQKIQMPTAAEVAKIWVNPPSEYGPEPYYGMNGPVTIESLAHDLDVMKSLGFRAVTAQAGGGMPVNYLTPEYFAFFKQFALEAKKRDMKVWIVDDIGYPSGFAGGIFATSGAKHDLSMQALTISQRLAVAAGASLKTIAGDAVAATAVSATGERVAVPVDCSTAFSSGTAPSANSTMCNIAWTAPADKGDWTVFLISHLFRTSPTKSDTNPTHAKDSTQPLEDYLNPAATAAYIEATHNGYYKAMPELFGSTILGFRGDEPDYSISGLPWTPAFFDTFQKVKGYDIRPYLGAILLSQFSGRPRPAAGTTPARPASGAPPSDPAFIPAGPPMAPAKLTDAELRAKGDYYDVFSQMFRDGFFKPQGVWCADHGVAYQVHLNHEEMEMDLTRSEGDFLRDMKYVEVPGIDAIWHQIWTDTISDYPRLASSAAHVYGHPQSFTESFAAYRPAPDVTMARYILNEQLVRGINVMETMFYSATRPAGSTPPPPTPLPTSTPGTPAPPPRRGGPSEVMLDPAWPALMDYVRRVGYVMSMGRPAASVAVYIPSSSMWLNDRDSDTAFVATEQMLSERQIDFDIINQDALASDLKPTPRALESMSGNSYHTVIIPSAQVLTQTELDRLKALAKGGGNVLFLGKTPSMISGKTILDSRAATPADFSFATVETSAQLPPTPTPPAQAPTTLPGPQIVPPAIEAALKRILPIRDVELDRPDPAIKVTTRRLKDAAVYLFFNEGPQVSSHTVTLWTKGRTVQVWDPATGLISQMEVTTPGGFWIQAKLDLQPYESRLITIQDWDGPIGTARAK